MIVKDKVKLKKVPVHEYKILYYMLCNFFNYKYIDEDYINRHKIEFLIIKDYKNTIISLCESVILDDKSRTWTIKKYKALALYWYLLNFETYIMGNYEKVAYTSFINKLHRALQD